MQTMRRGFLTTVGTILMAFGLTSLGEARDLTATEKANLKVVNDFSAAWATGNPDKVTSFLSDDCVVRFLQTQPPVTGRAAVSDSLKKFMGNSTIVFEVHESFAAGPLVTNLRTDTITGKDGKKQAFRVAGVFYLKDGKIIEWIDAVVENR